MNSNIVPPSASSAPAPGAFEKLSADVAKFRQHIESDMKKLADNLHNELNASHPNLRVQASNAHAVLREEASSAHATLRFERRPTRTPLCVWSSWQRFRSQFSRVSR